jgi:hypothetical protein
MNACVTVDTESNQVLSRIIAESTAKTEMVYLQFTRPSAILTSPAISV